MIKILEKIRKREDYDCDMDIIIMGTINATIQKCQDVLKEKVDRIYEIYRQSGLFAYSYVIMVLKEEITKLEDLKENEYKGF